MTDRCVLLCMGTRPEIIKMAPVYHALKQAGLKPVVLHTGQHDSLAEPLYLFFDMKPDYQFDLSRERGSLGHLFAIKMERLDLLFADMDLAAVLVQGDTSSALSGALSAFYHKIPVGHIEAGLRSHHAYEPYPEEKNRELIARLANWHFVPTGQAMTNLQNEGINKENCYLVGNTIIDAANWTLEHINQASFSLSKEALDIENWLNSGNINNQRVILVTAHRRESWDGQIANIAEGVRSVVEKFPDIRIIWPVHPNPVVKDAVHKTMNGLDTGRDRKVWLSTPLNYPDMLYFLQKSWLVLTDSGGLQEEAVTLKRPVLVLRDKTERPEVVTAHGGAVIGTTPEAIAGWVEKLYSSKTEYKKFANPDNPFGDGRASQYIAQILFKHLVENNTDFNLATRVM